MKRIGAFILTLWLIATPSIAVASTLPTSPAPRNGFTAVSMSNQADTLPIHASVNPIGYRSKFNFHSHSYGGGYSYRRSPYGRSYSNGFGSHLFALGAGYFLGRLFNPFGYGYGFGLGLFHLIFDVFIVWILFRLFRGRR